MRDANTPGPDFIDAMMEDERKRNIAILAALVVGLASSGGLRVLFALGVGAMFLSTRKPGNTSFVVFFQRWFKETLYPQMSQRLKEELEERSKQPSASIFSSLKDTAQSFLLDKTTGVRAELAWAAFSTSFRPVFRDFYFFRTASVNMGGTRSGDDPVFVVFIGINQNWYLSPLIQLDFDSISVLRMMEGQ